MSTSKTMTSTQKSRINKYKKELSQLNNSTTENSNELELLTAVDIAHGFKEKLNEFVRLKHNPNLGIYVPYEDEYPLYLLVKFAEVLFKIDVSMWYI